jgi:microsomal epoxide hydrolase
MADYAQVPSTAKVQPKPFKVEIDANEIQVMKHLLAHSKIGPATYENQQTDRRFGMNRDWLIKAKKHWEATYDWYLPHPPPINKDDDHELTYIKPTGEDVKTT